MRRILVAGVGNIFLGDDAFGVELARRLCLDEWPESVRIVDYGIRSLHLAYELVDGDYDLTLLLDATPRGGPPGTLYVLEPEIGGGAAPANAHSITPDSVCAAVRALGGKPGRVLVAGCEPASIDEGMGLSAVVSGVMDHAIQLVRDLIAHELKKGAADVSGDSRPNRAAAS
jgi:hydrogenase maturation protease